MGLLIHYSAGLAGLAELAAQRLRAGGHGPPGRKLLKVPPVVVCGFTDIVALSDVWKTSGDVSKPTYGCQVTILSEQEKQMMKMYRREEKKERKKGRGAEDGDPSDAALTFDPREMRALRYVVLQTLSSSLFPHLSL